MEQPPSGLVIYMLGYDSNITYDGRGAFALRFRVNFVIWIVLFEHFYTLKPKKLNEKNYINHFDVET